ncbi:MAG: hypothetical protein ACRC2M_12045 [Planktothrix sp.]
MKLLKLLGLSVFFTGISLVLNPLSSAEPTNKIVGNCGTESCETLWKKLQSNFPKKTQDYQKECLPPQRLGLLVYSNKDKSKIVYLTCWEAKIKRGERLGQELGVLPFPGYEQEFGVKIASDDPKIQAILKQNSQQVERMSFKCATHGGEINILVSEDGKETVSLQCYFQAGLILFDYNRDGVSDGEYSRGASVDFTEELK